MDCKPLDFFLLVLLFIAVLLFPDNAHAYIDPSTGGMLLQLLLAGVAGALVITKLYWQKLKATLARMLNRAKAAREDCKE